MILLLQRLPKRPQDHRLNLGGRNVFLKIQIISLAKKFPGWGPHDTPLLNSLDKCQPPANGEKAVLLGQHWPCLGCGEVKGGQEEEKDGEQDLASAQWAATL